MYSPRVLCQVTEYIRKFSVGFFSAGNFFVVSVLKGKFDEVKYYRVEFEGVSVWTSQGKQSSEMRKFLVSFLNGSLEYHADVIAGRQIHKIYNK